MSDTVLAAWFYSKKLGKQSTLKEKKSAHIFISVCVYPCKENHQENILTNCKIVPEIEDEEIY